MKYSPTRCIKCGNGWNPIMGNLIITYEVIEEELMLRCTCCGYITHCDCDDRLEPRPEVDGNSYGDLGGGKKLADIEKTI